MKGQTVGYLRVSHLEPITGRQLDGHHLDRIFVDQASGRVTAHPEYLRSTTPRPEGDAGLTCETAGASAGRS